MFIYVGMDANIVIFIVIFLDVNKPLDLHQKV